MGTSATDRPGAGNEGAGQDPAQSGAGGGAGQSAGEGAPSAGEGAGAGQGQGAGGGSLDRSKLSEPLRNLNEDQINQVVETLFTAVSRRGADAAPPPRAEEPPAPTADDYKEMFDPSSERFNPAAAIADVVQRNYGGLIRDIGQRATTAVYSRYREEYPDFKEYEKEVSQALQASGVVNPTDAQIQGVYFAAKGQRAALKERQARAAAASAPAPSPANMRGEVPREEPLDDEEKLVARRMFPNAQDPEKAYREYARKLDAQETTMKVPFGGGNKR